MAASNSDCPISRQVKVSGSFRKSGRSNPDEVSVAQLLFDSGAITRDQLDTAMKTAAEFKQPVTKVLNIQHKVAAALIESAQQAQSTIDESLIDRESALDALRRSSASGLPFDFVVARRMSQTTIEREVFSDLELILFESKIATAEAIREARCVSKEKSISVATSFFSVSAIQFEHLNYAFECLHFIDRGWLTKADAIRVMSNVKVNHIDLRSALELEGFAVSNMLSPLKLGDLLLHTKLIDEENLIAKLEESINARRLLGSVLMESELIDEDHLIDALIMQGFCAKDLIDSTMAIRILRKTVDGKRELASVASEYNIFRDDPITAGGARDLLLKAGIVTLDEIDQAESRYYHYGMDCLHAIVAAGFVTPASRDAAIECSYLVSKNLLTVAESILVLQKCNRPDNDLSVELQLLSRVRRQERESALEQAITDGFQTNSYSLKPRLYKSVEFLLLTLVAAFTAWGVVMSVFSPQFNTNSYSCLVVTLIAGLAVTQIGFRWQRRLESAQSENALRTENAKDTVKRLSHSKRKLA